MSRWRRDAEQVFAGICHRRCRLRRLGAYSAVARARLHSDELRYFLLRRQLPAQEQPEPPRYPRRHPRHAKLAKRVAGHDAFISLACISNDASFELDENLSTSVNLDAFEPMVLAAKDAGVQRFIFASSSSVYGVSDQPNVTEEHPLVPLTLYNKYKGMCEPLLFKHTDGASSA